MRIFHQKVIEKIRLLHWGCGWKGWIYLTIFILTTSHLFFSQQFLLSFNINNQIKQAESNELLEKYQMNEEDVISRNQLSDKWQQSTDFTTESDNINWTPLTLAKMSIGYYDDENNETNQMNKEHKNNNKDMNLKERHVRYWLRSKRIKQVCNNWGVVSNPPIFTMSKKSLPVHSLNTTSLPVSMTEENPVTSHFSLARSFKTMGCFLNKVASSSLVSAFLLVHGLRPQSDSPHSLTSHLIPRSLKDFQLANKTFFKFMFVRHPMDRMLSCYLDKMVDSLHHSLPAFRNQVKTKAHEIMIRRQQQRDITRLITSSPEDKPQLPSVLFVRESASLIWNRLESNIIADVHLERISGNVNYEAEKKKAKKLHRSHPDFIPSQSHGTLTTATQIKPTFEEFLEYVLDTDLLGIGYDSHWVPFHRYCSPCSVPYDVIGKLETAADDFQYIWENTRLITQVPVPWINGKKVPPESKIALEKKYYSSLPKELILRFYDAFRMDFELFDYNINDTLIKAGYTRR